MPSGCAPSTEMSAPLLCARSDSALIGVISPVT